MSPGLDGIYPVLQNKDLEKSCPNYSELEEPL